MISIGCQAGWVPCKALGQLWIIVVIYSAVPMVCSATLVNCSTQLQYPKSDPTSYISIIVVSNNMWEALSFMFVDYLGQESFLYPQNKDFK